MNRFWASLTDVVGTRIMTSMVRTQIYLPEEELRSIHKIAKRNKTTVARLVRQAIRQVWLDTHDTSGLVGIVKQKLSRSSVDHDSIYDQP